MSNRFTVFSLAIVLAGLFILTITGQVRDLIVIPLLTALWIARRIYESIPQTITWGGFLAIAALVAVRRLVGRQPPQPAPSPVRAPHGRVAPWMRLFHQAQHDDYARWHLAQRLGQCALELLAFQEQCQPQEVRQRLEQGSLNLPPAL